MCSLRWGRLMSRWVSSKLTSVSDRVSPGQAFYHWSSIIRSHCKTPKETDSKAGSQTKNRASKAKSPVVALLFTTISRQPCYCYDLNFKYWWSICYLTLPRAFIDYTPGIFVRRDDKHCWKQQQWNVQSFFFRGFIFCFKLTESPRVCFFGHFITSNSYRHSDWKGKTKHWT